jgi:hypothetical protein
MIVPVTLPSSLFMYVREVTEDEKSSPTNCRPLLPKFILSTSQSA